MATRIAEYLESGTTYFIAVGIFHLIGPGGLCSLLRERGYTVVSIAQ
jgi:uncharacterized protein YbaP (TraB family)